MDWNHVISLLSLIVSTITVILLFWVQAKASKIDKLEEKLDKKAEDIINARFTAIESRIQLPFSRFDEIIARIEKRLERGEAAFGAQAEVSHSLDKKIVEAKADIRAWAMENLATVRDLHELRATVREMEIAMRSRKND